MTSRLRPGHFETAVKLNPENMVAKVNHYFNDSLQAGQAVPVDLSKATADKFGKYRSWEELLSENGPFDEPSFCFESGVILMRSGLSRQAVAPLNGFISWPRTTCPRVSGWRSATSPRA